MAYAKPPWSYEPLGRACTHFDVVAYTPVDEHHNQVRTKRIASLVNREHVPLLVASPELYELWKEYVKLRDATEEDFMNNRIELEDVTANMEKRREIIDRVRDVLKRVEDGISG